MSIQQGGPHHFCLGHVRLGPGVVTRGVVTRGITILGVKARGVKARGGFLPPAGSAMTILAVAACAVAFPGFVVPADAQSVAAVQPPPPGSPIPRIETPPQPTVAPPVDNAVPADANTAPSVGVTVRGVAVDGVTVYPAADIDAVTAGLTGSSVPLDRIEQARLNILRRYRDDGYSLVAVDTRRDANGVLRFTVSEGHIADVKLDGDVGPAGEQVLRFLRRLTDERPVKSSSLERAILLAQDIPGLTVQTVLVPSEQEPGALTLVARVKRQIVSGALTVDNRAYQYTGREEALATLDLNSFTSLGERSEFTFVRTPLNHTQIFGQASEEVFIGGSGLRVRLYGGAGRTNPNGALAQNGYEGVTTVFGTQVAYPIIKRRQQVLSVIAQFDATDSQVLTGTPSAQQSSDNVRAARIGLDEALNDALFGFSRPGITQATVRLSQGLPFLGASANNRPDAGRLGERFDFRKISMEVSRDQTLFAPWEGATVSLYGLISGQAAQGVLPPSEKFFLGGLRFNRGFYSGQVTGDNALTVSPELRLTTSMTIAPFGHQIDIGPQFYVFYDWGETWENQKTDAGHRLQSFGGGARVTVTPYTELDVEGVGRITRQIAGTNVMPLAKSAFYWRVLTRF